MNTINNKIILLKPILFNHIDQKLHIDYDIFVKILHEEIKKLNLQTEPEELVKNIDFIENYNKNTKQFQIKQAKHSYYVCKILKEFTNQAQNTEVNTQILQQKIPQLKIVNVTQNLGSEEINFLFDDNQNDKELLGEIYNILQGYKFQINVVDQKTSLFLEIQSQLTPQEEQIYQDELEKLNTQIDIEEKPQKKKQYSMSPQDFASLSGYKEEGLQAPEKINFYSYINDNSWKEPLDIDNPLLFGELKKEFCKKKNNKDRKHYK